jgi:putative acetyltransferase
LLIQRDAAASPDVVRLLQEHLEEMLMISPAESVHALDTDGLQSPDMTFWSAWEAGEILGCGALKELDLETGEVKSMRTRDAHRRQGVAACILEHIVGEARRRGYALLYLETGSMAEFSPARSLYERNGFEYCGPFGQYRDDSHSVFMTKRL